MTAPAPPDASRVALDGFLATLYRLRPVDATFIGAHDHDHRWPDWSPAGHEQAVAEWRSARGALADVTPPDEQALATGDWTQIDGALALSHIDLQIAELTGAHFTRGNPSLVIGEAAFGIIALITREFLSPAQRASWLMRRMRSVPAFLAGALTTLRDTRIPAAWREKALREARATAMLLDTGVPTWCLFMGLPADRLNAIHAAAQRALGGVHAFAAALEQLPGGAADAAACGEEFLALCLARGHWSARSLDELRREVMERLQMERARLDQMIQDAGATSVAEVQQRLASLHPTPERYYGAFGETWEACRELSIEKGLVTWPDAPVRYVPIPEWTREAAPALYYLFYRSPAPLEPQRLHDYVVTPIEGLHGDALDRHLHAWNNSVIKLNHVVHHGALGHHVQNWHAARAPSRIGQIAAVDCASRIAMLQGGTMAEGWACYATDLKDEAGFLTADERVAEQQTRVRMLARAINDVEFHVGRRTLDESVRFYVEEIGMPVEAARGEAVKNSMFPGTAMMYWLGTQGVHDLRAEMQRRAGAAFDLRAFHDAFLSSGSIPVALNARLMLQKSGAR